jgi:Cytochrome c oxidase caa3 assembly factor (Caa3_CtaG)
VGAARGRPGRCAAAAAAARTAFPVRDSDLAPRRDRVRCQPVRPVPTNALGSDPIADQATGGGIAWGFGETPILSVTLVVFAQWVRSDARAARRFDRQAVRDSDAMLADYNAHLQQLHERQSKPA